MTRFAVLGVTLVAILAAVGLARAESPSNDLQWSGSTFCMYAILLESHVIAEHCGVPLDNASEARYQKMILTVRSNILENTNAGEKALTTKRLDEYEASLADHHHADGQQVCRSADYASFHDMLSRLTSEKASADILKHFSGLQRNPYTGDCL